MSEARAHATLYKKNLKVKFLPGPCGLQCRRLCHALQVQPEVAKSLLKVLAVERFFIGD